MQGSLKEPHDRGIERLMESGPIETRRVGADGGRDSGKARRAGRQKPVMIGAGDDVVFRPPG